MSDGLTGDGVPPEKKPTIHQHCAIAMKTLPPDAEYYLESRADTMGGKPVFIGTRLPAKALVGYFERNISNAEILDAFPVLHPSALSWARKSWNADRAPWLRLCRGRVELFVDPNINSGALSFAENATPVHAVVSRINAGESVESVAADFDLEPCDVETVHAAMAG